jgi:hypothetical protein
MPMLEDGEGCTRKLIDTSTETMCTLAMEVVVFNSFKMLTIPLIQNQQTETNHRK